jgi:hypothetical protein
LPDNSTIKFTAKIEIIGVNPFVYLPARVLKFIFKQARKDKGKIPVTMKIEGFKFKQTLIKYSGHWRLYLNTPMRRSADKDVGDKAEFEIAYDPLKRTIPLHPKLIKALDTNIKAKKIFEDLSPSLRLEIVRYISFLKTEESIERNVKKAIGFLLGKERFIGRAHP